MSASSQCPHPQFDFSLDSGNLDGPKLRGLSIQGRCTICGARIYFAGGYDTITVSFTVGAPDDALHLGALDDMMPDLLRIAGGGKPSGGEGSGAL